MNTVRVRFAPSPTGYLHVGGARTALFNWLYARSSGGTFILRIEDTDVERSSREMVESILASMSWLGLDWDDEPYYQSTGLERHRRIAGQLMDGGSAYPCFCGPEELEKARKGGESGEKMYLYPRTCLNLSQDERDRRIEAGEPYAVRFLVPEGETVFEDLVYGRITVKHENIDDFVLLRRDGNPTYQLAVVADDAHMEISHVIRGDDHLSNTPKQILLYRAMKKAVPSFAHLPLILGPDKKRLSKRHGATAITSYREMGFLPEAVVNFLALLGWSPGDDVEKFSLGELTKRFSLERVSKKSAVFDLQKLEWLNGQYISERSAEELFPLVTERWVEDGLISQDDVEEKGDRLLELIDLLRSRMRLITDFTDGAKPFFQDDFPYDETAVKKRWKRPEEVVPVLRAASEELEKCSEFTVEAVETAVRGVAEKLGTSNSKVFHPVRVAMTGRLAGPGLFELMVVIGRDGCLKRLARAIDHLEGLSSDHR